MYRLGGGESAAKKMLIQAHGENMRAKLVVEETYYTDMAEAESDILVLVTVLVDVESIASF